MIYQELSLAPHLTVAENIFLGNELAIGPFVRRTTMLQRAKEALQQVGRSNIAPTTRVDQLSIADQQLVEIARSIAIGCKVLVLDEPTSSITARDVRNLFVLIKRLRAQGIAVIYISHFLEEIAEISDRYTVLRDGKSVATGVTAETNSDEIVQKMVGRQIESLYSRSKRDVGEVLLQVDNVAGKHLPTSASLELRRGEVLGIAGLIGSGRTEFFRTLFGLDPIKEGSIKLGALQAIAPSTMWKSGVGLVSEDRKQEGLALNLSIADNLTLPSLHKLGHFGFVSPKAQRDAAIPWLEKFAVRCRSATQKVGDLSGGNQQKIAIARLLQAEVDVLLLDEPTRGIDVGSKALIYELIDALVSTPDAKGNHKAVLMISSYLRSFWACVIESTSWNVVSCILQKWPTKEQNTR